MPSVDWCFTGTFDPDFRSVPGELFDTMQPDEESQGFLTAIDIDSVRRPARRGVVVFTLSGELGIL